MKLRVPLHFGVRRVGVAIGVAAPYSHAQSPQDKRASRPSGADATQAPSAPAAPAIRIRGDPLFLGGNAAQIPVDISRQSDFRARQLNGGTPGLFLLDSARRTTTIEPSAGHAGDDRFPTLCCAFRVLQFPMPTLPVVAHPKFRRSVRRQSARRSRARLSEPHGGGDQLQPPNAAALRSVCIHVLRQGQQVSRGDVCRRPYWFARNSKFRGHKTYEAPMVMDTALDYSVLFSRAFTGFAENFRVAFQSDGIQRSSCLNDGAKIYLRAREAFELKPYTVQESIGAFSQQNLPGAKDTKIAGAIGGGFLRRFNVIFDLPHQRMILEPNLQHQHARKTRT